MDETKKDSNSIEKLTADVVLVKRSYRFMFRTDEAGSNFVFRVSELELPEHVSEEAIIEAFKRHYYRQTGVRVFTVYEVEEISDGE